MGARRATWAHYPATQSVGKKKQKEEAKTKNQKQVPLG